MKTSRATLPVVVLVSILCAAPRDAQTTFALLKKGSALSASEAAKLEERLSKKPNDEESRIQLLSYYVSLPATTDVSAVRAARSTHILWLVEHDPKDGLGLFNVQTGVYRLRCSGDSLADPDAVARVTELWLKQVERNSGSGDVRRHAVDAIQFCSPEKAEELLIQTQDRSGLGRLYANAVLGVTGESYLDNDPTGTDSAIRQSPFAQKAARALDEASDKDTVVAAASAVLRQGAILWSDGKLDWDYTPLGNKLLSRAKDLAPDAMNLLTLPTKLPARGERPPITLRVGGNVQLANLIRKVDPVYPDAARRLGIQGTVQMTALIGLDGRVLNLQVENGPAELVRTSIEAVQKWVYKPTTFNGNPCYVITRVDVNYKLSPQ